MNEMDVNLRFGLENSFKESDNPHGTLSRPEAHMHHSLLVKSLPLFEMPATKHTHTRYSELEIQTQAEGQVRSAVPHQSTITFKMKTTILLFGQIHNPELLEPLFPG